MERDYRGAVGGEGGSEVVDEGRYGFGWQKLRRAAGSI